MIKNTQKFHQQVYDESNHETTQNPDRVIMLIQLSSILMHGSNRGSSGCQLRGGKTSEFAPSSTQSSSPTLLSSEYHLLLAISLIRQYGTFRHSQLLNKRNVI